MSWWHHFWPPQVDDTTDEARAELQKLQERDDEIARLGRELHDAHRRNNFSGMVQRAITRTTEEGV